MRRKSILFRSILLPVLACVLCFSLGVYATGTIIMHKVEITGNNGKYEVVLFGQTFIYEK